MKDITYYIYHIPGKKIGVTTNLKSRVEDQQGYGPGEYEILARRHDISEAAKYEVIYQRLYGYPVDIIPYDKLNCNKNKLNMKINITEQTTTFPCPANKLKGQLMDNIGMSWSTVDGNVSITTETVKWIIKNVKTSMYTNDRCYIYNKAFAEYFKTNSIDIPDYNKTQMMFNRIRTWANDRGLYEKGNTMVQYVKLQEEAGELAKALLKDDQPEVIDAIGDMVVVLTNLAHQRGVYIETCIQSAYEVINKRTGKMINGTFVKDEN